MNHKTPLSADEKFAKIEFLRKQRNGLIIGSYRNMLAELYEEIESLCKKQDISCTLENLCELKASPSPHDKNLILDRCLDLEQLGYIAIYDTGIISIVKKIDF